MSRLSRRRRGSDRDGGGGGARAARRGASLIARVIGAIAGIVALILALAVLLVVLEANPSNDVVELVLDAGRFLAGPFKDVFDLDNRKVEVAVNYGIAGLVYLAAAGLVGRLLHR